MSKFLKSLWDYFFEKPADDEVDEKKDQIGRYAHGLQKGSTFKQLAEIKLGNSITKYQLILTEAGDGFASYENDSTVIGFFVDERSWGIDVVFHEREQKDKVFRSYDLATYCHDLYPGVLKELFDGKDKPLRRTHEYTGYILEGVDLFLIKHGENFMTGDFSWAKNYKLLRKQRYSEDSRRPSDSN
jgi:hypothetical protein